VYASAWLRCRFPAEFLCALVNAQPMGFYSPASLVQDARRHGVEVRPPCMARSDWPSRMEGDAVRLGLRLVEGLGADARATLERARAEGPFTSIDDVVRRTRLSEAALRALAGAGAFDAFVPEGRREALWGVLRAVRSRGDTLPFAPPDEPAVAFRPLDALETLAADYRATGLTTGVHPMTHLRPWLAKRRVLCAADLEHVPHDRRVTVAGLVTTRQRPEAAKGFFFVTLEDETGFTNIIVPPRTYERHRRVLVQAGVLLIHGRTSREQDVCNVKGQRFEELDFSAAGPLPPARSFR
jgi:error-prone DNA polymerase